MTNQPGKISKTDFKLDVAPNKKPLIYLLGGFQITWGDRAIRAQGIRLRRGRDLLKLLALAPDHRIPHEQALELIWPERDPVKSAHSLNQVLYLLRPVLSSLDPTLTIQLDDTYLALNAQAGLWTDVEAFEQAARNVQINPDPAECQAALILYRGDLLPEDLYSDLFSRRREELREMHCSLLRQLAAYHASQQEYPQAIELLLRLVDVDPTNEEAQGSLIRAYAASGLNQTALNQYRKMAEMLQKELGVMPCDDSRRLYAQLIENKEGAGQLAFPSYPHPASNLPAELSSFIGRAVEVDEVCRLVRANRLVTLTGAGGVGKTRLGLKVAERLAHDFTQGLFWVELASLGSETMLIPAVNAALGIRAPAGEDPLDLVKARLRDQPYLLVLDNAEHILAACARLAEALLKGCPRLHVLVTSRAPLDIQGERLYRVPSMSLPAPDERVELVQVDRFEALRLFVERAQEKNSAFEVSSETLAAVQTVCQRLDGIPLAIELAAARTRLLTVAQIAARLDDVFSLLTSSNPTRLARHRTLKATIEWSYRLLGEQARQLLQRLSVFAGVWSVEAAEVVCAGEGIERGEVLDLLGQLVDQSLVALEFQVHGVGYYRLLETVRQYARERLFASGGETALRERHLVYFTALADQADTQRVTEQEVEFTDHLYANLGNLRAALDWSLNGGLELGMRLCTDLYWFWTSRGLGMEAIDWWFKLLEAEEAARGTSALRGERRLQRARVLRCMVQMSIFFEHPRLPYDLQMALTEESIRLLSDEPGPRARHELGMAMLFGNGTRELSWFDLEMKALAIFREEGDKVCACTALGNANIYLMCSGEYEASKRLLDEFHDLAIQARDINLIGAAYNYKGDCAVIEGNYPQADMCYNEYERYTFLCKDRFNEFNMNGRKIFLRVAEGKYEQAFKLGRSALALAKEFQDIKHMGWITGLMARCAWSMGDDALARDYCQAGLALSQDPVGDPIIIADPLFFLGRIALSENDLPQAASILREACIKVNDCNTIPFDLLLDTIAVLAARQDRADRAAVLFGRTEPSYQKIKNYLAPRERSEHEEGLRLARAKTGETLFETAFQRGSLMTREEASAFALDGLE